MNIKKQINRNTFNRLLQDPKAIIGVATYTPLWSYTEHRSKAVYKDGFIYMKVECKPSNKPAGTVRHTSTYVRYTYCANEPKADKIAFFLREEV